MATAKAGTLAVRTVDPNISDLFFNMDFSQAIIDPRADVFPGYDSRKLDDMAEMFLASLARLNVAVPSRAELLADFFNRI